MKYDEAVRYIEDIPRFTKKNTLEHTRHFLEELGVRQEQMKIIHVAGTNGKGTVCAVLANILKECGKSTGLFISPHLVEINERIRINNKQITNEEFEKVFNEIKETTDRMVEQGYPHPSFFEFLFLMAMYTFYQNGVEYVVLETGLGGRLDATNSVREPILTIITSIGLDHMEYLGDTVQAIAGEKAGIIKEGVPVIYWGEDKDVSVVIERIADEKHAPIRKICKKNYKICEKTDKGIAFSVFNEYYLNDTFSIPFIAEYQVQNVTLVIEAISQIETVRDLHTEIITGIQTVKWEGRMEIVGAGVIFDGAHNGLGIDEFVKTFKEYECRGRKLLLFSVMKDKDYDYMVSGLAGTEADIVFVTQVESNRGLDIQVIADDFQYYGCQARIIKEKNAEAALFAALEEKREDDVLFCVGSLYLIGELKSAWKKWRQL